MARKVFISFLGTTGYVPVHYDFGGNRRSRLVKYIQEAMLDDLWERGLVGEDDRAFIFCTDKSTERNWLDRAPAPNEEPGDNIGLMNSLAQRPYAAIVEKVDVPDGICEQEIWEVFSRVYERLQDGDEIFFDVTHAFRSIPLFATVLFHFTKFLRHTVVRQVAYGAFEKLGFASDVRKLSHDERVAPVVDLTQLIRLQEYTELAMTLENNGRVDLRCVSEETDGSWQLGQTLKNGLMRFDDLVAQNDIPSMSKFNVSTDIFGTIRNALRTQLPKPMDLVLRRIKELMQPFKDAYKDEMRMGQAMLQWAIGHKMLQAAYTIARENIISQASVKLESFLPDLGGKRSRECEANRREFVSCILSYEPRKGPFSFHGKDYSIEAAPLLSLDWVQKIRESYKTICDQRNHLNHAKGSPNRATQTDILDQLKEILPFCTDIIAKGEVPQPQSPTHDAASADAGSKVFINLSNHPSQGWEAAQLAEAQRRGAVEDMSFPIVPPDATDEQMSKMADKMVEQVSSKGAPGNVVVHIMGEMTLTFRIVESLKKKGYICVASTTQRDVMLEPDGVKRSVFRFVSFRNY